MKKIAIIGGGIIGMTLANYLDSRKFEITVYDDELGQATKASAGIISPWLSKRRNQKWYQLAKDGAAFFPKLITDFNLTAHIYQQTGTLIVRPENALEELAGLAEKRQQAAPEIGEIHLLNPEETAALLPLLRPQKALYISGGARLDGQAYLAHMKVQAQQKGIKFCRAKVDVNSQGAVWQVRTEFGEETYDFMALTPGPRLKELMLALNYSVDLRPQKGQLLVFKTNEGTSGTWPVAMLEGQADLIPFHNGHILIGATHENEASWDLTATKTAYQTLTQAVQPFLAEPQKLFTQPVTYRVGTRAYTSDFAPFFGPVPTLPHLVVASGLGSSGLTTGPYIGYQLAHYFNSKHFEGKAYQKPIEQVIKQMT